MKQDALKAALIKTVGQVRPQRHRHVQQRGNAAGLACRAVGSSDAHSGHIGLLAQAAVCTISDPFLT